jgi:hypothetical protein
LAVPVSAARWGQERSVAGRVIVDQWYRLSLSAVEILDLVILIIFVILVIVIVFKPARKSERQKLRPIRFVIEGVEVYENSGDNMGLAIRGVYPNFKRQGHLE